MWYSTAGCIIMLTLGLLAMPLAAAAQPAGQMPRLGVLAPGSPPQPWVEVLRQGLRDLGYVEGQNLIIEPRYAEGRDERLPELAAELVRLPVDIIVAGGSNAIRAAQDATRTIPIVMAAAGDPVGTGLITSLARPGGNITGMSLLSAELPGKRLEILKEAVSQSTRIAVLMNPTNPGSARQLRNLTEASRALGLHLHVVELRRPEELDGAFAAMSREQVDALFVMDEPLLMNSLRAQIADFAAKSKVPAIYGWRAYVDAGGLLAYGPRLPDLIRRAAVYVDKILKGAKPGDLPVVQPTTFELIINLKAAKALGLTIPSTLLFQADEVLQ
jgi:putative tryptophan/tyrosine transport system substrate-binding protein